MPAEKFATTPHIENLPVVPSWETIARCIVESAGVQAGDLVLVRGGGNPAVLEEVLLAVEEAGATPLPEISHPAYLRRLIQRTGPEHLAAWDRHRLTWLRSIDRLISLGGASADLSGLPTEPVQAWEAAVARLGAVEERRNVPFLLVAVPDAARAEMLGIPLTDLEAIVLPALAMPQETLQAEIDRALALTGNARTLTLRTGRSCELRLDRGDRAWLHDDGVIDEADRAMKAVVSNLPAGSIYTTVIEQAAEGTLWLPEAGPAKDVTMHFQQGRVIDIQARAGCAELGALLDRHSGESRRISHIGIGLNPHLHHPIGWVIVDEHVHGALFVALGENRYLGGENASSLNIDFTIPNATLLADDRIVVREGVLEKA